MNISQIIGDHTLLIGFVLVGSFVVWKFIMQPIMNEGKSIKPTEEDIKTFEEKMQENMNPETNI